MRYFLMTFGVCVVLVMLIAGKRGDISRRPPIEVFPDMDRQLKLHPQEPNAFFENGVSSQLPPPGTIAQSTPMNVGGQTVYRFQDSPVNTGRIVGTTNFIETNPFPVTAQLLERGRERYTIFCAPCHGQLGNGEGITKKLGMLTVVTLQDKRIVALPDGDIFNTITHGKNTMGAYGPQIPVEDRWAIVAYLRALQLSQLGLVEELPPESRAKLR